MDLNKSLFRKLDFIKSYLVNRGTLTIPKDWFYVSEPIGDSDTFTMVDLFKKYNIDISSELKSVGIYFKKYREYYIFFKK